MVSRLRIINQTAAPGNGGRCFFVENAIFLLNLLRRFVQSEFLSGSVPEWLKGMGCKPIGVSLRWFESSPAQLPAFRTESQAIVFSGLVSRGKGLTSLSVVLLCESVRPCSAVVCMEFCMVFSASSNNVIFAAS